LIINVLPACLRRKAANYTRIGRHLNKSVLHRNDRLRTLAGHDSGAG